VAVEVARTAPGRYSLRLAASGRQHEIAVSPNGHGGAIVAVGGSEVLVARADPLRGRRAEGRAADGPQRLVAPMPGKIVKVLVAPGDQVALRQGVVVVEAMKMENELRAGRAGIVREVLVVEGASVEAGAPLVVIG
jgi:biotin carboxyl carrier protein